MKKKLLASLLAAAMAVTALTGCGSSDTAESAAPAGSTEAAAEESAPAEDAATEEAAAEDDGEVVELEFWAWWSSDARKPYIQQMVDDFNASQSKYHVTYVDIPWGVLKMISSPAGSPCCSS